MDAPRTAPDDLTSGDLEPGDPATRDVVVAGAGPVGLALAVALAHGIGGKRVVLVDPRPQGSRADARASAIAAGPRRMLEAVGVWPRLAALAQPVHAMELTDTGLDDPVRPRLLDIEGGVEGEPFAHMVENGPLVRALAERAAELGVGRLQASVEGMEVGAAGVALRVSTGGTLRPRLLAAADGVASPIRALAGIATTGWEYGQLGLVATIRHERPHGGRAVQHFLPGGPFAQLPLTDDAEGRHRSSLVWTELEAAGRRLLDLDEAGFRAEVERRLGPGLLLRLGAVELAGPREGHPLRLMLARRFAGERLALVGDAAHAIHPLAGQGLNLGLRDAAALAECVADAMRLGLDPGGEAVLARYARWRRFDTLAMGMATDGLSRLFGTPALRGLRDIGMGLVDRLPGAKRLLVREAAGLTGTVPRLMR